LPGSAKFEGLVNWLASRQTDNLGEDDDEEDKAEGTDEQGTDTETGSLDERVRALPGLTEIAGDTIACAGFNGRCNKVADTCYSFWNGATLLVSTS
jgi:geranylgeranyl transferase type-1 subunit beta